MRKINSLILTLCLVCTFSFQNVCANETNSNKIHTILNAEEIIGNDAVIWNSFENGDTMDLSYLETDQLGKIIVPSQINSLRIKGSADREFSLVNISARANLNLSVENFNVASSTGSAVISFGDSTINNIDVIGENKLQSSLNSACIIGNVTFSGDGSLYVLSGENNLSVASNNAIRGNVVFNHTGYINIASGDGEYGAGKLGKVSKADGPDTADAIAGNVECYGNGEIVISGGEGSNVYITNTTTKDGVGGNGGMGINGNLLCRGNNKITISGGRGGSLGTINSTETVGTAGFGVKGNVIVKNATNLSVSGGLKVTTGTEDGGGVYGYVKAYDNAVINITGGEGFYAAKNCGGSGGIGVLGDVELNDNVVMVCSGGNGIYATNNGSYYVSGFAEGGNGGDAIRGNVTINNNAELSVIGGNGGKGGSPSYTSGDKTSLKTGSSFGGSGGNGITGDVIINDYAQLNTKGGNGSDGGRVTDSYGGDAGNGIVGNLQVQDIITINSFAGTRGNRNSLSLKGRDGKIGRSIVSTDSTVIDSGYINADFYNSLGQILRPINSITEYLYKTKLIVYSSGQLMNDTLCTITDESKNEYNVITDENGVAYCYLPSGFGYVISADNSSAIISYIWEDDNNTILVDLQGEISTETSTEMSTETTTETSTETSTETTTEVSTLISTETSTETTTETSTLTETSTEMSTETTTEISTLISTETSTEDEILLVEAIGDVDMNGTWTAADAAYVIQKTLNSYFHMPCEEDYPKLYMLIADVNGDNVLTASDSANILQKALDNSYIFEVILKIENGTYQLLYNN